MIFKLSFQLLILFQTIKPKLIFVIIFLNNYPLLKKRDISLDALSFESDP